MTTATVSPRPLRRAQPVPVRPVPTRPAAHLRVVEAPQRILRHIPVIFISVAIAVVSLLVVVVGHTELLANQVRLQTLQAQVDNEQIVHAGLQAKVAAMEAPSRIVAQAEHDLRMVEPPQVTQLIPVPLNKPIPTPEVSAAPSTTPVTTPSTTPVTTPASTTADTTPSSTAAAPGT